MHLNEKVEGRSPPEPQQFMSMNLPQLLKELSVGNIHP